ncbi:MAG TPA: CheR family methyltransferase [Actinomycetota bacterium]|jgi:two-component system CheB/CheR fusion protein
MSTVEPDKDLEILLDYLRRSRGFDFTGYKRTSLSRRVQRRMQAVGVEGYLSYLDYLEVVPDEFTQLFNTILINVTGFFRDPPAWEYVAEEVLPRIVSSKKADEPIRIWSAGSASGEEAYTLAMMAAEALGVDAVRERVKIYATDVDEEALNQARQARYGPREVEGVPAELLERYFERDGSGYVFSKELRRSVIFGRHDLVQDAPISRIDVLVCRNVLTYFNSEAQARILARFSFALQEGGFLFLGKAEMLLAHSDMFTSVDLKRRVFRKVPQATLRDRLLALANRGDGELPAPAASDGRVREAAFEAGLEAQLVVDSTGHLLLANERARKLFNLTGKDPGRLFQDLEVSYRPLELRSMIQQASVERRPSALYEAEWRDANGEQVNLEVQLVPLFDEHQALLGVSVSFDDVTRSRRFQQELEQANRDLEDAYAELQSTNEELETTNEELQSTVEELETTNEELQTINDELSQRTTELNQVNAFLESIWASLDGAVAVLDPELRVLVWNHRSEDLWGVRPEEVQGRRFLNLDIGLPVDRIRPILRATLSGERERGATVADATNRRGKRIGVRVTTSPLLGSDHEVRGVIVLVDEQRRSADGQAGDVPIGDGDGSGRGGD